MVRLDEDAFRDEEPEALNSGINGFGTLLGQVVTGQHSEDAAIEKVYPSWPRTWHAGRRENVVDCPAKSETLLCQSRSCQKGMLGSFVRAFSETALQPPPWNDHVQ